MDLVIHKQEHLQMHWYNKLRDGLIYIFMMFPIIYSWMFTFNMTVILAIQFYWIPPRNYAILFLFSTMFQGLAN